MSVLRRTVQACLALLALMAVSSVVSAGTVGPPANYVFTFQGDCADCIFSQETESFEGGGIGTATLELQNYSLGLNINAVNFVSFSYSSARLSTLVADELIDIFGSLFTTNPTTANFAISFTSGGMDWQFSSNFAGAWEIGLINEVNSDFGTNGIYNGRLVETPEPASLALIGVGLMALGAARRRRKS